MTDYCGITLPQKSHAEWTDIFLSLERLDDKWGELLTKYRDFAPDEFDFTKLESFDACFEQLTVYLAFRYFSDGVLQNTAGKTAAFIAICCNMIRNLFAAIMLSAVSSDLSDVLIEIVRMFSAEVEYSDCNIEQPMMVL